ncbi:conserved hypothetical protein [Nitrosomonas nitrosa]|uniref:Antitoxin Xre/MbcA/ParS-like toxin-binding domain-containing protein n=1 Tax=Nitrosomonas nitrosa TaxID=52442 RepID=A0A8H9D9T2_9PROT|nr:SEC-C metal-binding domain-containing protein [Nitrosomonas nitrosa]CAE6502527.1 conserved hypothetical protein [Nitrosomonas nitrosa]
MKAGRNDPCPCGSGKKYKKCCMGKDEVVNQETFLWHRVKHAIQDMPEKLLKFTEKQYGRDALLQAWDEFIFLEDEDFSLNSPHLQVFMPWLFFDWLPFHAEATDEESELRPIAQLFLEKQGHQQDPLLVRYLEQCCAAPFSFYDILSVRPGESFVLRDIFTGEELDVTEHSGSRHAQAGYILFAKVVKIDNLALLEGSASLLFPPTEKFSILELRQEIEDECGSLDPITLKDFDDEMLQIYHEIYYRLHHPTMPRLQNSEGSPLLFQQLIYDIPSPQVAFDALKSHVNDMQEDELLADAQFSPEGELRSVELPWLKQADGNDPSLGKSVLGHIKIEGKQLTAEVNSESRALRFRQLMDKLLPTAHYKTSVIESPQAMLAQAKKGSKTAHAKQHREDLDQLHAHPEVQAQITEILREHYRRWPEEKLPALKGKTPLQAIKTKDGREMVEALIRDFELKNQDAKPPIDPAIFTELRERLGLKE